jgi:2-oxoglutarate ferredoxin oxidoreductase subunit beta
MQTQRAITKGIRKKGTAFIEIMSQCPIHLKQSPTDMLKVLKENSVRIKDNKNVPQGKIPIGEFCDIIKPEWIEGYQKIIDQFSTNH